MRLRDINKKIMNDGLSSLSENASLELSAFGGLLEMQERAREYTFRRFCRRPGTRIGRIMAMIEAGRTDAEIKAIYKMDTATVRVYRMAYNNELSVIRNGQEVETTRDGRTQPGHCTVCGGIRDDEKFMACSACRKDARDRQNKSMAREKEKQHGHQHEGSRGARRPDGD